MPGISNEIREYVRKYIMSRSPGMYILLSRVIMRELGADPAEAVIKKPRQLLEVLRNFYGDDMEAVFIFRSLFLKPLALLAGNPDLEEELYRASMQGCRSLIEVLGSNGVRIDPTVCED